jgi:hypothetical protein
MAKLKKIRIRAKDVHHGKVMYHVDAYTETIMKVVCLGTFRTTGYESSAVDARCELPYAGFKTCVYLSEFCAGNEYNRLEGYFHNLKHAQQFLKYCEKEPIVQSLIDHIQNLEWCEQEYDFDVDYDIS